MASFLYFYTFILCNPEYKLVDVAKSHKQIARLPISSEIKQSTFFIKGHHFAAALPGEKSQAATGGYTCQNETHRFHEGLMQTILGFNIFVPVFIDMACVSNISASFIAYVGIFYRKLFYGARGLECAIQFLFTLYAV